MAHPQGMVGTIAECLRVCQGFEFDNHLMNCVVLDWLCYRKVWLLCYVHAEIVIEID
jgi:hypothetical protein